MAKLGISTGTTPNDGTGDSLVDGALKINSNFDEIYDAFGDGSNLSVSWSTDSIGLTTTSSVGIGTTAHDTSKLNVYGDLKVGINTTFGVILTSPNGTEYRLYVDNSGNLLTDSI